MTPKEKPVKKIYQRCKKNKMTDQEIKLVIQKIAGVSLAEIHAMERGKLDEIIREIKKMNGVTTMQLARLIGITQSVIVRV